MVCTHSSASTSELAINRYPSPGHSSSKLCLRSTTLRTSTISWTLMRDLGDSIRAAAFSSLNTSIKQDPRDRSWRSTYHRLRSYRRQHTTINYHTSTPACITAYTRDYITSRPFLSNRYPLFTTPLLWDAISISASVSQLLSVFRSICQ